MFYVSNSKNFINTPKKEKEETKDKYPGFDQGDERRNMSDREY